MTRRRVGILVFDQVEALDFRVPFEVFSVTWLDEDRRREEPSPYEVVLVADEAGRASTLTSACTGSLLPGRAGLLDGRRATVHGRILEEMRTWFPALSVIDGEHVVEDGPVITSAGISAGIDMALRVVVRHHGEAVARPTARHMEYPDPEDNRRRV